MRALVWCALAQVLAPSGARVYERCELARDMLRHGAPLHQLATWLCIAYHESRFNTAAVNAHSGDYGILQISQLYWCGDTGANVCGAACSDFVDDDIADDVRCALRVYRDHHELQGDGFMAWVAYPMCGDHHVKKFLADCGDVRKNVTSTPRPKALRFPTPVNATYYRNIDALQLPVFEQRAPPPPSVAAFNASAELRGRKPKLQHFEAPFKFDIDALKLPVFPSTIKPYVSPSSYKEANKINNEIQMRKNDPVTVQRTLNTTSYSKSGFAARNYSDHQLPATHPAVSFRIDHQRNIDKTTDSPLLETVSLSTNSSKTASTPSPMLNRMIPSMRSTTSPTTKMTTSIFDLYLRPRRPTPTAFSFTPFQGSRYHYKIFAEGTTTPYTPHGKYVDLDLLKGAPANDEPKYNHWLEDRGTGHS